MDHLVVPWLPEGRLVPVDGRGEMFARVHLHHDPAAPVVLLLHGWTASSDIQFVAAYGALAERYTFVGIDHRGHGRGLRTPARFSLEDAADDAAALLRTLGLGPAVAVGYSMGGPVAMLLARRHRDLVSGLVVQATALDWRTMRRDRFMWRMLPVAGSWLRSKPHRLVLERAVPRLIGATRRGPDASIPHPIEPYVPWLLGEMSRTDPFVMVDAGRALGRYDAKPWASTLGLPAASLVTTADRLVPPRQQRALAAALEASVRELPADHFATLSHPEAYAALTVALIEEVRQRASTAAGSSSSVAG